ncbi:MAG: homocysteine S-methyltransferase family protein [Byssovorax sp.]
MSDSLPLLSRLGSGRPLLVSMDAEACMRAMGVSLHGPAAIGRLLREHPAVVAEHYHREIGCGVDVLAALTADTIPRALAQIGMTFRAAALTGCAVDLALDAADAAPRPILVAGVLGHPTVASPPLARVAEELAMHATRLAAAGCELILARGFGPTAEPGLARLARRASVISAGTTELPTWAVLSVSDAGFTDDGESLEDAARAAVDGGAQLILLEIERASAALPLLDRLRHAVPTVWLGAAPAADAAQPVDTWVAEALVLLDAGIAVLGGGPGTTGRHLAALARMIEPRHPPPQRPEAG